MSEPAEASSPSEKLALGVAVAIVSIAVSLFGFFLAWDPSVTTLVMGIADALTAVAAAWVRKQRSSNASVAGPAMIGLAAFCLIVDSIAGMVLFTAGTSLVIFIWIVGALLIAWAAWALAPYLGDSPYARTAAAVGLALAIRLILIFFVFRDLMEELGDLYGVDLLAEAAPPTVAAYAVALFVALGGVWLRMRRRTATVLQG